MRQILLQERENKTIQNTFDKKKKIISFSRGSKYKIKKKNNGKNIICSFISDLEHIPVCIYNTKHNYNAQFSLPVNEIPRINNPYGELFELITPNEKFTAIIKEVQIHPVAMNAMNNRERQIIHMDFMRIYESKVKIKAKIKIINANICPGLKMKGVLFVPSYFINIECPVDNIINEIICDIQNLQKGQKIKAKDLNLTSINSEQVIVTILDK